MAENLNKRQMLALLDSVTQGLNQPEGMDMDFAGAVTVECLFALIGIPLINACMLFLWLTQTVEEEADEVVANLKKERLPGSGNRQPLAPGESRLNTETEKIVFLQRAKDEKEQRKKERDIKRQERAMRNNENSTEGVVRASTKTGEIGTKLGVGLKRIESHPREPVITNPKTVTVAEDEEEKSKGKSVHDSNSENIACAVKGRKDRKKKVNVDAATPVARKTKEPGMTKRPGAQSGDVEKTNENTISSGNKTRAEIPSLTVAALNDEVVDEFPNTIGALFVKVDQDKETEQLMKKQRKDGQLTESKEPENKSQKKKKTSKSQTGGGKSSIERNIEKEKQKGKQKEATGHGKSLVEATERGVGLRFDNSGLTLTDDEGGASITNALETAEAQDVLEVHHAKQKASSSGTKRRRFGNHNGKESNTLKNAPKRKRSIIGGGNGDQAQMNGGAEVQEDGEQRTSKRPRKRKTGSENPANLSHFEGEEKDILVAGKLGMKLRLITEDAFPALEDTMKFAMQAMEEVADSAELPDDSHFRNFGSADGSMSLAQMKAFKVLDRETWIVRGTLVKPALSTVRHPISGYRLTSKAEEELGSLDVDENLWDRRQELIRQRVDELFQTKAWTRKIDENGKTIYFGSPAIPHFITTAFFATSKSLGSKNLKFFKPMPIPVIALACVALHFGLDSAKKDYFDTKTVEFSQDYRTKYHQYIQDLEMYRSKRPKAFKQFRDGLYLKTCGKYDIKLVAESSRPQLHPLSQEEALFTGSEGEDEEEEEESQPMDFVQSRKKSVIQVQAIAGPGPSTAANRTMMFGDGLLKRKIAEFAGDEELKMPQRKCRETKDCADAIANLQAHLAVPSSDVSSDSEAEESDCHESNLPIGGRRRDSGEDLDESGSSSSSEYSDDDE